MKTIRVFVSSTFLDMHAERDYINRYLMPELRSRCLRRGAELVAIDLRWGITAEEARQRGTLEVCLDEIRRSQFFVCLLGDRLGYVPAPEVIPANYYRLVRQSKTLAPADGTLLDAWYLRDESADSPKYVLRRDGRLGPDATRRLVRIWEASGLPQAGDSITALEIRQGALGTKRSARRAFFYIRKSEPQRDPDFPRSFVSRFEEQGAKEKLAALKEQIHTRANGVITVREYEADYAGLRIDPGLVPTSLSPTDRNAIRDGVIEPAEWPLLSKQVRAAFDAHGTVALKDLEQVGQRMLSDLWAAIETVLEKSATRLGPYERSWNDHEQFLSERTQIFIGRDRLLTSMLRYVENNEDHDLLAVTGSPGCGKSSLLAECARRCRGRFRNAVVLPYFVGAAPDTTDITTTVRFLCSALKRACRLDAELPTDPARLSAALPEFLEKTSAVRPVILILDAINQLDPAGGSHELHWLPFQLPVGVKIIVSTLPGDCLDHLRPRVRGRNLLRMRGMPRAERAKLVNQQLERRGKRLSHRHLSQLLDTKRRVDADLPLYLMVALEELSLVGGLQALDSRIESLPATLEGLFDRVLQRLEWDHSRDLCESVLRWLAASRSGLSEFEILELLGTATPPIRWARLYRAMQFYLRPTSEGTGSGLIGFYHEQLRSAVFRRYLRMQTPDSVATRDQRRIHRELATYFRRIATDGRDPLQWHAHRPRGLSEHPYHLHRAGLRQKVRGVLLDFEWLRLRLDTSDVTAVIDDYNYLPTDPSLRQIQRAIRQASHVLQGDRSQLASQLVGRLAGERDPGVRVILAAARRWRGASWFRPLTRSLTNPNTALVRTLSGHRDAVFDFGLTPDGRFLVSGSRDKTVKLWELSTGRVIRTLTGHTKMVRAVAVSADGRRAISASMDRTVRIWDLASGRLLHTLKGHKDEVDCLALSSNGRQVISGSSSRLFAKPEGMTFKVWDLANGRLKDTFFRTGEGILLRSILNARDERFILLERWDGTHDVTELVTARVVCTTADKRKHVACAAMTPDAGAIALGREDGRIDLVSLQSGRIIRQFTGHAGNITTLQFTPDGLDLISGGGRDRTVRIWNLARGRDERVLRGHSGAVSSAMRTPDGRHVLSSSYDTSVKIWDLGRETRLDRSRAHSSDVRGVVATPDGTTVISCSDDGTLGVWNTATGRLIRTVKAHDDAIFSIAITRDGRCVLTGGNDCTIKIWEVASWTECRTLTGARGTIAALDVAPEGHVILSGSWDDVVTVWDTRSGTMLRNLRKHTSQVNCVALAPDGRHVLSGSDDKRILVRKLNGGMVTTLAGHRGHVNAVQLMPDARHAVSASADRTVRVWDLHTGEPIHTLRGHTGGVNCIAVTPSGRCVVSGSDDMTVKVFEIESRRCMATFSADGEVRACALVGDLELVAAGTADGSVHFLRFERGQHLTGVPGVVRRKKRDTGARYSTGIH